MSDTPQDRGGEGPQDLSAMLSQFLGETAQNPELAEALRGMGIDPSDPATLATLTTQMRSLFDPASAPDPAELATTAARAIVAAGDADPSLGAAARRAVADAVGVAQLWVDPVTTLPASPGSGRAWS
ncbi:MAG TPA: zinc-dependent metalloprotease, partial [Candidatus Lustribacter sp.]|nr:zinc-dependent metalloprotease [Candidatus Lustribacter sp.]